MITQLKTKTPVVIDLFNLANKQTVYCKIVNFIQEKEEYRINGSYYWLEESGVVIDAETQVETPTFTEKPLKNFSRTFSISDLDALFVALNITYPTNSSYTEKRIIELKAGIKYIVAVEPILGLTGNDWE